MAESPLSFQHLAQDGTVQNRALRDRLSGSVGREQITITGLRRESRLSTPLSRFQRRRDGLYWGNSAGWR